MKQMAAKETGKVASGVGETQEDLFINDTTLCVCVLSRVQLFEAPWTVACQVSLSMEFSRQNIGVDGHSLLQRIFPTQG